MNPNNLFMVKGERCSGTTYLENLLIHNLNIEIYEYPYWKHGYLQLNSLDDMKYEQFNIPIIFIFRNVFDWLRSFYLKPHHLEGAYSGLWVKDISFSEFLRREVKNFDEDNNERMSCVINKGFALFDIVDFCYYDNALRQVDLIFINNKIKNDLNLDFYKQKFDINKWKSYSC